MRITFSKYQGTGNDFVMLDNLNGQYNNLTIRQIAQICDRKMGVGADGLIKLSKHPSLDFDVEYYNSDGSQSFCGNGARCSVSFANSLGIVDRETTFNAIDGAHKALIDKNGIVHLEMLPVISLERSGEDYVIDTGSPHYIRFTDASLKPSIVQLGKDIRYSETYLKDGINVNTLVQLNDFSISVETYERGVEDETLSCGTGVTACALAFMFEHPDKREISVVTKGGELSVRADKDGDGFKNIWLSGPAKHVFDGSIVI